MYRKRLGGLIALNVALAVLLVILSVNPEPAEAQARRRIGDYIMIAALSPGQISRTIYIIDLNNSSMLAVLYRSRGSTRGEFEVVDYRNIAEDFIRAKGN